MIGFLSNYILWIKAFHVIAVIAWMSGMLYLPRLFVYHTRSGRQARRNRRRFKMMERRLLRAIMNPAMIAVWIFGLTLASLTGAYEDGWFQAKFALGARHERAARLFRGMRAAFRERRQHAPRPFLPNP